VPACSSLRDPNGRTHAHRFRAREQQQQPQQQKSVPSSMEKSQPNTDEQSTASFDDRISVGAPEVNTAAVNPLAEEIDTKTSPRELSQELSEKLDLGDTNSNASTIKIGAIAEVDSPHDPCHLPEEYFPITCRGTSGS